MAMTLEPSTLHSDLVMLTIYSMGVLGALVIYGLLQERIMSKPYGGEYFTGSLFLVLCNRLCCMTFAAVMIVVNGEARRNVAPLWKYFVAAFSNVGASACQYDALKYVSFPVQMLGKSFKMMPVMAWGVFVMQRRYLLSEWLVAACVTGGVSVFLSSGPIASSTEESFTAFGLALVAVFLTLDGFTATLQERLLKEHATSKYNQMFYINLGSASVAACFLILTGTLLPSVRFMHEHTESILHAGLLSTAALAGQWFIFAQVKEFGSLAFAATMNVRQVVSISLSYAVYGHAVSATQFLGLAAVFSALFFKSCSLPAMVLSLEERQRLMGGRSRSKPTCGVAAEVVGYVAGARSEAVNV